MRVGWFVSASRFCRWCPNCRGITSGGMLAGSFCALLPGGGSNYEESRSAETRADFIHKVSIAAKEVRESRYWLCLVSEAGLRNRRDVEPLVDEAGELVAILTSSAKTAKARTS